MKREILVLYLKLRGRCCQICHTFLYFSLIFFIKQFVFTDGTMMNSSCYGNCGSGSYDAGNAARQALASSSRYAMSPQDQSDVLLESNPESAYLPTQGAYANGSKSHNAGGHINANHPDSHKYRIERF